MKKKVTIIDYGVGNILNLWRAFEYCGAHAEITDEYDKIQSADYLVLCGVGAFSYGMAELKKREIINSIRAYVAFNRPFLGVCLGMQMMFSHSEEEIYTEGLNLIEGKVVVLPKTNKDGSINKIPHIAWNKIIPFNDQNQNRWSTSTLKGIDPGTYFYFVHSYHVCPKNSAYVIAKTPFGDGFFTSVIQKKYCIGVQFHPEKSGIIGLNVLRNFLAL